MHSICRPGAFLEPGRFSWHTNSSVEAKTASSPWKGCATVEEARLQDRNKTLYLIHAFTKSRRLLVDRADANRDHHPRGQQGRNSRKAARTAIYSRVNNDRNGSSRSAMNSITSSQNERPSGGQTELPLALFPSPLCCAQRPVKGRDERLAGALDCLPRRLEKCCQFLLATRPTASSM